MENPKERTQGGSSEELEDGSLAIEDYVASLDTHRVTAAGTLPYAWPFHHTKYDPLTELVCDELEEDIKNMVVKAQAIRNFRLWPNAIKSYWSSEIRQVIVIESGDETSDFSAWQQLVGDIQDLVDDILRERQVKTNIQVEIRDPARMNRDRSSVIRADTAIQRTCLQVDDHVASTVEALLPQVWTSISYLMRGPEDRPKDRRPTVVIGVERGTKRKWDRVHNAVSEVIRSNSNTDHVTLSVELLPGLIEDLVFMGDCEVEKPIQYISSQRLPELPRNGSSIGARGTTAAGSLGVFVYFQGLNDAKRKPCILVSHHVISPGDADNEVHNDRLGIALNGEPITKEIRIDYPAPFDQGPTIKALQEKIKQGNDKDGQLAQMLSQIRNRVSSGGIGKVIHSSGRRINHLGQSLDWALVELSEQVFPSLPKNHPPLHEFTAFELPQLTEYSAIESETVSAIVSNVEKDTWVLKVGRTTGVTCGEINSIRGRASWKRFGTEIQTRDLQVVAPGGDPFARGGDSGSMVLDINKAWAGMLWGTDKSQGTSWFTSTREIIEDIKMTTGGKVTLQ